MGRNRRCSASAMRREGPQAVPIFASIGEEILSTRTGDAQFYRALKEWGVWGEMKQVNNYELGGTVGGVHPATQVRPGSGKGASISVLVSVQIERGSGETEATSRNTADRLAGSIRAVVTDEIMKQQRPGGILSR